MAHDVRNALLLSVSALISAPLAHAQTAEPVEQGQKNVPDFEPAFPEQTRAPASDSGVTLAVEAVAEGLVNPWGIAVLPDGGFLVTERAGDLRMVSAEGELSAPIEGVPEVLAEEQGGLLDVALGPDFAEDRMIYLTYAKPLDDGMSATAAARGMLAEDGSALTEVEDIFVQEPGSPSPMHYGSRIDFDGEGHALITTGEHFTEEERVYSQDLDKTYGKVIRVNLDGSTPEDNPFVGEQGAIDTIWSYGHRNIQGSDVHPETGELWTIEHGPQGGDELNRPEAGLNYGWPVISYGQNYDGTPIGESMTAMEGMEQPVYYWDPVIAPGGMLFYEGEMFADWQGDLLIASLLPGAVVRLELDGDTVTGEERLLTDQGRVRDITAAADGALLVLIDDPDGSVLRLTPETATN